MIDVEQSINGSFSPSVMAYPASNLNKVTVKSHNVATRRFQSCVKLCQSHGWKQTRLADVAAGHARTEALGSTKEYSRPATQGGRISKSIRTLEEHAGFVNRLVGLEFWRRGLKLYAILQELDHAN
jgi:hypothetical protein